MERPPPISPVIELPPFHLTGSSGSLPDSCPLVQAAVQLRTSLYKNATANTVFYNSAEVSLQRADHASDALVKTPEASMLLMQAVIIRKGTFCSPLVVTLSLSRSDPVGDRERSQSGQQDKRKMSK